MKNLLILAFFFIGLMLHAQQECAVKEDLKGDTKKFTLTNGKVDYVIVFSNGRLSQEMMMNAAVPDVQMISDGNYQVDVQWVSWIAPGKDNNADNIVSLTTADYAYKNHSQKKNADGSVELKINFFPVRPLLNNLWQPEQGNSVQLCLIYKIFPSKNYIKRKVGLTDPKQMKHWVEKISAYHSSVQIKQNGTKNDVFKKGGFGQPIAMEFNNSGAFWGLEYPSSVNTVDQINGKLIVSCDELMGAKITKDTMQSNWVVISLTPDTHVKDWFFNYINDIRFVPLRPYALYNTWYDLRSVSYEGTTESQRMNEKNVMKLIQDLRTNMIEKNGIHLDAFVMDDGWDIFESDWVMNKEAFPHGLMPIANELKKTNTDLGIWFGPTGGYSYRMKRVNWMKEHGYEIAGNDDEWNAMLCVAGQKYGKLFRDRVVDMVKNEGVSSFKWDGVQYSCNEASHGHNIGRHSTKACVDAMIGYCNAVREANPKSYVNLTSGVWLSPWWVMYADQIWMCGMDYGFSDVPSLYKRDASVTYKDIVMYDNYYNKDLWFPLSNLMTHGTIKATIESVGGKNDPFNKFTDDVVFYFARGVTMYELYISPSILNESEWFTLSQSIKWARDRFQLMEKGYMIGGNPSDMKTYGYLHFKGDKGIIAARNPIIKSSSLTVTLDPSMGLDSKASNLVLERVYPSHWISPRLYSAGSTFELPLSGFESAVYEIYPLEEAKRPLIAGVVFDLEQGKNDQNWNIYKQEGNVIKVLNPELLSTITVNGQSSSIKEFCNMKIDNHMNPDNALFKEGKNGLELSIDVPADFKNSTVALLFENAAEQTAAALPFDEITIDGKAIDPALEKKDGKWYWYSLDLATGKHKINFKSKKGLTKGKAEAWLLCEEKQKITKVAVNGSEFAKPAELLPLPVEKGFMSRIEMIGGISIK